MKIKYIVLLNIIFFYFVPLCHSFYSYFSEEAFVNFISAKTISENNLRFYLRHSFDKDKIASANLRFGYRFFDSFEVYLSGLFHSSEIPSGSQIAKVSVKEYEIFFLKSFLENYKIFNLSFLLGLNQFFFEKKFNNFEISDNKNYYFAHIIITKDIKKIILFNISPIWIYEYKNMKNIFGIGISTKLNYKEKLAFIIEYPILIENPYNWLQPWSYGLQFHLGPHMVTLFVSNTYGFTYSNLLQGLDKTFYGFTFSF